MRVEMMAAILTTAAELEALLDDSKGASARAGSDDDADDVEPGEHSDPGAGKSLATRHVDHTYVNDSLSSSEDSSNSDRPDSSSEDDINAEDNAQDTSVSCFRTRQNPIFEQQKIGTSVEGKQSRKQTMANSVLQHEDVVGNDEGNYANEVDERSRLMAAAQAASIPSDSDDYFSDDERNYASETSRLMAAAQAASISSDDDFSDDDEGKYANVVDERSRLMAAAQAAGIPSDDNFSDDEIEYNGSRDPRSMPQTSKERSTRGMPTNAKAHQDSQEHEFDGGSSSVSDETDSERSSSDDESQIKKVQKKTRIRSQMPHFKSRRLSRNTAPRAEEKDPDDELSGSERGCHSSGSDMRKPKKNEVNSASFPPRTASFNWSNVKTKVFYSFRALRASSAGSSRDENRTISVRNLAREITDHDLRDFFQDCGRIVEILVTRVAQSGLKSAYLEFESGDAARKALRKSGKKLEGRVIICDITYENAKGSHSGLNSGHGVIENSEGSHSGPDSGRRMREKSKGSYSGPDSVRGVMEKQSGLKIFPSKLQDGDEKFLSRFSEQDNINHGDIQPAAGKPEYVPSTLRHRGRLVSRDLPKDLPTATRSRDLDVGGRKGVALARKWRGSHEAGFEDSFLMPGKTQAEIEQSIYFDAKNLEATQESLRAGWKIACPWGRRQPLFWPWKWPCWQWQHSAKQLSQTWSSTWARRKTSNFRATELKLIDKKRKSKTRRKTSRASGHKVIDTVKRKNVTKSVSVNCESVSLWC